MWDVKRGTCAFYKGIEVRADELSDNKIELFSRDSSVTSFGFTHESNGIYTKIVKGSELDSLHIVYNYALYKEKVVELEIFNGNKLSIYGSGSSSEYKKMGFTQIDRGEFRKWVEWEEVDYTWIEREPIDNYQVPIVKVKNVLVKNGIWALYNKMELEVRRHESNKLLFVVYGYGPSRVVDQSEIDSIYCIENYAQYRGATFSIIDAIGENLLLYSDDSTLCEIAGCSTGSCWVKSNEVDRIWAVRKPIWGFPEPNIKEPIL